MYPPRVMGLSSSTVESSESPERLIRASLPRPADAPETEGSANSKTHHVTGRFLDGRLTPTPV